MNKLIDFFNTPAGKVVEVMLIAVIAHIFVVITKQVEKFLVKKFTKTKPKWNSVRTLGFSVIVFIVYFIAFGKMLQLMGVSLTAYLATASVIGLAIGFGTQGVIQDIVTGVTIVLSNLFDVGNLVEINGVNGIVKSINMRFVEIEDQYHTKAFIPNRTISKVVNYPKGYLTCSVDFNMNDKEVGNEELFQNIQKMIKSIKEQYPTVFRGAISLYDDKETTSGKKFTRIKLRMWPGRTNLIEGTFKQELLTLLKDNNPDYKDWMLSINYEVENGLKNRKAKG